MSPFQFFMERKQPFSNPPKTSQRLLSPAIKRPPTIKRLQNQSTRKGIKVSSISIQEKPPNNPQKLQKQLILFLIFFTILFVEEFFIEGKSVHSRGILLINSIFEKITFIPIQILTILLASLTMLVFYNFSSFCSPFSITPILITFFLFLDTDLISLFFGSIGFTIAIFSSLFSLQLTIKMITISKQQLSFKWYFYQLLSLVFITISCICKYELSFLYLIHLIAFIFVVIDKKYDVNEKLLPLLTTLVFYVISIGFLFIFDSKTQIMRISFDTSSSLEVISCLAMMDQNGFFLSSLIVMIPCLFIGKNNLYSSPYFTLFIVLYLTSIYSAFRGFLSDSPDLFVRSAILRLIFIGLSSWSLSSANKIGMILTIISGLYFICSLFITLPHTVLYNFLSQ